MLSGKLPTGTVGTGDETDRSGRRTGDTVTRRPDGRPRTRSDGAERRPDRTGDASAATAGTGATTADGSRSVTPTTAGTGAGTGTAGAEPHATPNAPGGRGRGTEDVASAENSRLRRRLSDERAERQAVIDHYERLLTARTMAAADCEEGAAADTDTGAGAGAATGPDPGSARAWLRRAISRLRIAWSRRG